MVCFNLSRPHDRGHDSGCGCVPTRLSRRSSLTLGLAGAVAGSLMGIAPRARAASGHYEAMLLNCIDPRVVTGSSRYMDGRGWRDNYSQFVIAGGPIGVVSPNFASWHQTFWDNLAVSMQLHNIRRVVAITHRDCGAAKIAFGDEAIATPERETASHIRALQAFRARVAEKQPRLEVVTAIMALDGSVLTVG